MANLPSPEKIAKRLRRLLRGRQFHKEMPCALTISYPVFYGIAERKRIHKHLYSAVEIRATELGIIVGFGFNGVMIGFDRGDLEYLEHHT